jgi:hypothetical protein
MDEGLTVVRVGKGYDKKARKGKRGFKSAQLSALPASAVIIK